MISFFHGALLQKWEWAKDGTGKIIAPSFQCSLEVSQNFFFGTLQRCKTYSDYWRQLHKGHNTWSQIDNEVEEEVEIGLLKFSWVHHEAVRQLRLLQSCRSCKTHSLGPCSRTIVDMLEDGAVDDDEDSSGSQHNDARENIMDFVDNTRHLDRSPSPGIREAEGGSKGSAPDAEHEANELETPFDDKYDDYASAPLQTQETRNANSTTYVFDIDGVPLVPNPWFHWRDRGRRLPHKRFFRTIHTEQPKKNLNRSLHFSKFSKRQMRLLGLSTDSRGFSAAELLDQAGRSPGSNQSKRALIVGQEQQNDAHLFILDLEKDCVLVTAEDINISVDIDSLIWVTSASGFQAAALNVHLSPLMSTRAAISTNNFVQVALMDAPQDEDELRKPQLRGSNYVPLSQIPHIEFGYSGSGERRINFIIFFPRMVHKPQKAKRYATLLPYCLQDLWFDRVIIPACNKILTTYPGLSEYLPPSLQDVRRRLGYKLKSIFIHEPNKVLQEVEKRIREGGELLSCFGSFFVVADGRGMKVVTKQCVSQGISSGEAHPTFEQIKISFPDLDWDRMLDRSHGELYLDVGISYHSNTRTPLTGLWRIPSLRTSFSKMDSLSPTIHPLGTLAFYGGIKAEMSAKSKKNRHIISRISYCLAFETIRSPGKEEYLCSDKDIVGRTQKFLDSVKSWSELFLSAQSRSYGVRDEVRGLASTVIAFLPGSIEKVPFIFTLGT